MNRRQAWRVPLGMLLIISGLVGCSPKTGGPRVWLDQPLDGRTFALGPIPLLAHAADPDGLRSIEFLIDGSAVGQVMTDGARFGEAALDWLPPAPGTYTLEVVAFDTEGAPGSSAQVAVIVAAADLLAYGTPTPTPAASSPIVISAVTCGPAYTVKVDFEVTSPTGVESIELFSTYVATNESKLTFQAPYPTLVQDTLWLDEDRADDIDRPHQVGLKVYYPGQEFPAFGYAYEPGPDQRCPGHYQGPPQVAATPGLKAIWVARLNTHCRLGPGVAYESRDVIDGGAQATIDGRNPEGTWFRVQPPGSSHTCWVSNASGEVRGDLAGVPVVAAPPAVTPTGGADQPPVIQEFLVSPNLILTEGAGCPAYSRTVALSAVVSDDVGIGSVVAQWRLATLSGEAALAPAGGGSYTGAIGPVTQVGTMSISLIARDTSGASAQAGPRTVTVQSCIE